jgi:hypothetical protein
MSSHGFSFGGASLRLNSAKLRAGPEKVESGGDYQAARIMIHPAGWEEASLYGKTLFAGFWPSWPRRGQDFVSAATRMVSIGLANCNAA